MSRFQVPIATISIAAAGTVSTLGGPGQNGVLLANRDFRDADGITIFAPATLPEATTVQVAPNENPQAADWKNLVDPRTGVAYVIGAGLATTIVGFSSFLALRMSAAAVAAQRDFVLTKAFPVGGV